MQEGPVHDVQWTPAGDYFIVVAGFMPAKTMLFSATCKPVFDLGSGPHNLVRWSPQVAFLQICGLNYPEPCFMLAKTTLFSTTCKPGFDLGRATWSAGAHRPDPLQHLANNSFCSPPSCLQR